MSEKRGELGDGGREIKKLMWSEDAASLCVCESKRERGREEVVFPLQQSVGSAFTVAEQTGRHSRSTGSTWHAISSAPGTLAAQPAQPKHTSIGDQNKAKQTHTKHTDNMWGAERVWKGRGAQTQQSSGVVCLLPHGASSWSAIFTGRSEKDY